MDKRKRTQDSNREDRYFLLKIKGAKIVMHFSEVPFDEITIMNEDALKQVSESMNSLPTRSFIFGTDTYELIKNNCTIQLLIALALSHPESINNSQPCSYYYANPITMIELLFSEFLSELSSIFDLIFLIFSDPHRENVVALDLQRVNKIAREAFQKQINEGTIHPVIISYLSTCQNVGLVQSNTNKVFKVSTDNSEYFARHMVNNPLHRYLINMCTSQSFAAIPFGGQHYEELGTNEILIELCCIFDNVYLLSTCNDNMISNSIIVKGLEKIKTYVKSFEKPDCAKGIIGCS